MRKDEMSPEDEKVRPSPQEVALIQRWIDAGALEFNAAPPARAEVTAAAVADAIRADLDAAGERDRRYYRYFTITHLYNCGWSDDELASYRIALSKLVNSLSWGKRVIKPKPVDLASTIFRIDLRDYQW